MAQAMKRMQHITHATDGLTRKLVVLSSDNSNPVVSDRLESLNARCSRSSSFHVNLLDPVMPDKRAFVLEPWCNAYGPSDKTVQEAEARCECSSIINGYPYLHLIRSFNPPARGGPFQPVSCRRITFVQRTLPAKGCKPAEILSPPTSADQSSLSPPWARAEIKCW